jgi:homoserine O-acetyltransferase
MLTERPLLVRWGPALLLAAWALLLSSWAHFIIAPQRNLLNDEAVELLQTVDLPFNTFHYLAPAHQDRWCEPVESAGIYLNRLFVGPGRYVDTDRWFVVCSNVLGGCQGSTGPSSTDPATGRPHGSSFPVVTVRDMVRAQHSLAVGLGIDRWHAVVGGSMGGMQALEWAVMYPDAVANLVLCSTTAQASAQQVAWSHIGRNAITEDAYFSGGDYYDQAEGPHRGLSVARKAAHVTYRSDESFTERFGREMRDQFDLTFDTAFEVEHYLDHQGDKLVRRFDANSYIVLNRAMDYHDVGRGRGGTLAALSRVSARTLVAAISSDGLYPPAQQIDLHAQLLAGGVTSEMLEVVAPDGHDGFLTRTDDIGPHVRALIERGGSRTEEEQRG